MIKKITYSLLMLAYLVASTGFVISGCKCNTMVEQTVKCACCQHKQCSSHSSEKSCDKNTAKDCCPTEFVSMKVEANKVTNIHFPSISFHIIQNVFTFSTIKPIFASLNELYNNSIYINKIPILYLNCNLRL